MNMKKYCVINRKEVILFENDSLKAITDFCNREQEAYIIKSNCDGFNDYYKTVAFVYHDDFGTHQSRLAEEAFISYCLTLRWDIEERFESEVIDYFEYEEEMNLLWFRMIDRGISVRSAFIYLEWTPTKYIPKHPEQFPLWNEVAYIGPCGRGF